MHPFRLTEWRAVSTGSATRVGALVDGVPLWFESTAFGASPARGDSFLAVALLAAMAQGRDLDLTEFPPVSAVLAERLPTLQELWTQWNPWLCRVEVRLDTAQDHRCGAGAGAFFSGGVDAVHTALDDADCGDRLVYIRGFDFEANGLRVDAVNGQLNRLAEALARDLVTIQTNWLTWRRGLRLSGGLMHGGCLTACAHLLGFDRVTISASNSWARLTPWGTHPLLDRLWSNDRTTIRHWGSHRHRVEKCARIGQRADLLSDLRVCHELESSNCGRCAKCVRTRLMFHLSGYQLPIDPAAAATDPITAYSALLHTGSEAIFLPELVETAHELGEHRLEASLTRAARKLERRRLLRDARNALFPGRARRRMAATDLLPWGYGPAPASQ